MDTASSPGRGWLAGLLIVLLVFCGGVLLKTFWATVNPGRSNASTAETDVEPRLEFDLDEALSVLADSRTTLFEQITAMNAVERAGIKALPGLVKLLDRDTDAREQIIRQIGKLGPAAQAAAAPLRAACEDASPRVRQAAIEAAWNVHQDREVLREILVRALKEGPDQVSLVAIDYLSKLNPPAVEELIPYVEQGGYSALGGPATRRLLTLASHDRELLRRLLKMGVRGGPRSELEALVRTEMDDEIHLTALLSLVRMPRDDLPPGTRNPPDGSPNDSAQLYFTELVEAVRRHRDAPRGHELALWLGRSGPKSLPALRELFQSKHHAARCAAASSIAFQNPQAVDLIPELRELLKTDEEGTMYAVWAVEKLGEAGKAAIPEVMTLAKGSSYAAGEARHLLKRWGIASDSPDSR